MKFDENKVYTIINADKLKPGDKVFVNNDLKHLREMVEDEYNGALLEEIIEIKPDDYLSRFKTKNCLTGDILCSTLAYLVEEPEKLKIPEKHYRPFKNVDELIEIWEQKIEADTVCDECEYSLSKLEMPYIWIRNKNSKSRSLITKYFEKDIVVGWFDMEHDDVWSMKDLFKYWEFLDGSPCGVEE